MEQKKPFKRLSPGKPISASEVNRLIQEVEMVSRTIGAVDNTIVRQDGPITNVQSAEPPRINIEVTEVDDDGHYAWREVIQSSPGEWSGAELRSGTVSANFAIERNNRKDVVVPSIQEAVYDFNQECWVFSAGGTATSDGPEEADEENPYMPITPLPVASNPYLPLVPPIDFTNPYYPLPFNGTMGDESNPYVPATLYYWNGSQWVSFWRGNTRPNPCTISGSMNPYIPFQTTGFNINAFGVPAFGPASNPYLPSLMYLPWDPCGIAPRLPGGNILPNPIPLPIDNFQMRFDRQVFIDDNGDVNFRIKKLCWDTPPPTFNQIAMDWVQSLQPGEKNNPFLGDFLWKLKLEGATAKFKFNLNQAMPGVCGMTTQDKINLANDAAMAGLVERVETVELPGGVRRTCVFFAGPITLNGVPPLYSGGRTVKIIGPSATKAGCYDAIVQKKNCDGTTSNDPNASTITVCPKNGAPTIPAGTIVELDPNNPGVFNWASQLEIIEVTGGSVGACSFENGILKRATISSTGCSLATVKEVLVLNLENMS